MKRTYRKQTQGRRNRTRLRVQRLEARQLMAADIGLVDGFIAINGTEMDDVAEVYNDSGTIIVKVSTLDSDGQETTADEQSFDESDVRGIVFQAGDGNDLFINDTNVDSITRTGGGNDTVLGGGGNDILAVGMGNDVVLGGGGDDRILSGPGDDVLIPTPDFGGTADDDVESGLTEDGGLIEVDDDLDDPAEISDDATDGDPGDQEDAEPEQQPEQEGSEPPVVVTETVTDVEETDLTDETDLPGEETIEPETIDDENFVCHAEDGSHVEDPVVENETGDSEAGDDGLPDQGLGTDTNDHFPDNDSGDEQPPAPSDEPTFPVEEDSEPMDVPVEPADDPVTSEDESDDDVIFGGGGDDVIFAEAGSDLVFGGSSMVEDALLRMMIADRLGLS